MRKERRDAESEGMEAACGPSTKGKDQPWSQNGGVSGGHKGNGSLAEREGKEQGRQEAKMKSFKKASKNQALLDMINSALRESEAIPSRHFCDRRCQRPRPRRCWSSITRGTAPVWKQPRCEGLTVQHEPPSSKGTCKIA